MSLSEALRLADEEELDLVLIAPTANPPVCKITNYGKYRFEMIKREKEAKKNQKVVEVKEMQLSMTIETNDINIKAKKVRKFFFFFNKVKVVLKMHGRQLANPQMGMPIMDKFFEINSDISELTQKPAINGKQIIMVISPKNTK